MLLTDRPLLPISFFLQHLQRAWVTCDGTRLASNKFSVYLWLKARSNGHNNLSTFQEQKKCCHNIVVRGGQMVSTSAHNKCCENVGTVWSGLYCREEDVWASFFNIYLFLITKCNYNVGDIGKNLTHHRNKRSEIINKINLNLAKNIRQGQSIQWNPY